MKSLLLIGALHIIAFSLPSVHVTSESVEIKPIKLVVLLSAWPHVASIVNTWLAERQSPYKTRPPQTTSCLTYAKSLARRSAGCGQVLSRGLALGDFVSIPPKSVGANVGWGVVEPLWMIRREESSLSFYATSTTTTMVTAITKIPRKIKCHRFISRLFGDCEVMRDCLYLFSLLDCIDSVLWHASSITAALVNVLHISAKRFLCTSSSGFNSPLSTVRNRAVIFFGFTQDW